jgi:aryl-alcohol dehydrogenase-like predicted oxidoreductase
MKYGYLGKSNVNVSRVTLGTMHFGRKTDEKNSFKIMDKALDMGINFFDTANVYGAEAGATETIIGKWLAKDKSRRDKIVLASKVYGNMIRDKAVPNDERGISKYKVKKHLEDSLKRLQTDHLDLYQVHHVDRHITADEFFEIFEGAKTDGKILYLGTSNFPGWKLAQLQTEAKYRGSLGIVSEQTQYNLLNRLPELEVMPACEASGIGLFPYMPLAGGLLTGKVTTEENTRTSEVAKEYNVMVGSDEKLLAYSKLCSELGAPPTAVAIAWVLSHPVVSSAIVGIRTLEHLDVLDEAANLYLPEDFLERLEELFNINEGRRIKNGPAPEAYAW